MGGAGYRFCFWRSWSAALGHVAHGVRGRVHRFDLASRPFGESGSGPVGAAASSSPGLLGRQGYGQNGWRLSWVSGRGGRRRSSALPARVWSVCSWPTESSRPRLLRYWLRYRRPVGVAVSVYDGQIAHGPRAAALRAVCSCGWNGPEHRLDWDAVGEQKLIEAAHGTADTCVEDWTRTPPKSSSRPFSCRDGHCPAGTAAGGHREAGEGLTAGGRTGSPPAGGNRRTGRVPAGHDARQDTTAERAAAALGSTRTLPAS